MITVTRSHKPKVCTLRYVIRGSLQYIRLWLTVLNNDYYQSAIEKCLLLQPQNTKTGKQWPNALRMVKPGGVSNGFKLEIQVHFSRS
jgi:hypothetical protein